jgi:all-trans-8'-apo-beta-carotenal 15,15'-oxygenase
MGRRGAVGAEPQKLRVISGALPPDLAGTLYRSGPGRLRSHGLDYDHLFDGDGFLQRIDFSGGSARYRSQYVNTPQFRREAEAGRQRYRSFGTNLPGGLLRNAFRFRLKNAANTTPLLFPPVGSGDGARKLLTLWEGGAPHYLDPDTLTYQGHWRADGELDSRTLVERIMRNGRPFSAHPKIIPGKKEFYNFGLSPGVIQRLLLYRVNAETGAVRTTQFRLPRLTFMHDFVATAEGSRVFFDVGVAFHLMAAFFGRIPPAASVRGDPNAETLIRVFDSYDRQYVVPGPAGYVFHLPNGYQEPDVCEKRGNIIADTCWMESFPDADDFKAMLNNREPAHPMLPSLTRHTIDIDAEAQHSEVLSDYALELPMINPAYRGIEHRYVWGVAEPPGRRPPAVMHGIAKVDTRRRETRYCDLYPLIVGEPQFAGAGAGDDPEEDHGYLLSLAFDPRDERGLLLVHRADDLEEVARLALPEAVPLGFHGEWLPAGA